MRCAPSAESTSTKSFASTVGSARCGRSYLRRSCSCSSRSSTIGRRRAASKIRPAAKTAENTKTALESLRKKVEEQRQKLDKEKGLEKANGLFKQIEEGTRELTQKEKMDPTKAAVKLNDLAKQLGRTQATTWR